MDKAQIAGRILELTGQSVELLSAAYARLDAENPDLKEFNAFLTALKRTAEIARLAHVLDPDTAHERGSLESEILQRILAEED